MWRKTTMVLVLMTATLATSSGWAAEPGAFDDFYERGRKNPYHRKTWDKPEHRTYVGWMMEGIWAAHLMSTDTWRGLDNTLEGCWFDPSDVWQEVLNTH